MTARILAGILALLLALPALPAAAQSTPAPTPTLPAPGGVSALATPESTPRSTYTVGQCSDITRDELRGELESAALSVLSSGSNALDIESMVARQWRALSLDDAVRSQVSSAVDALAADTGYLERLLSGWSVGKAEEFAARIAEDSFTSPEFDEALGRLALAIGDEVARSVNTELSRAASAAFLCLRDYVGEQYSRTLFEAFEASVSQGIQQTSIAIDPATLGIAPIGGHMAGVTGASIIVITEIGRRVGAKVGQKLAGRVAGKVVGRVAGRAGSSFLPVVGWIVGIALIAYDLYEGTQGALPQIEEALTSEEVMQRVRDEVADAVRAGLPEEAAIAALETAVQMLESWDAFCADYGDVCALAAESPNFKDLLDDSPLSDLQRVAALESAFRHALGSDELQRALTTGAFDRLLALPPEATRILTETRSLDATLAWVDLAGDDLDMVAAIGMHFYAQPKDLDGDKLRMLIAINDGVAARKFLSLDSITRSALWSVPPETLRGLLNDHSLSEVVAFAAARIQPWVTATPAAQVARAYLAGETTLAQLMATPTAPAASAIAQEVAPAPTPFATTTVASAADDDESQPTQATSTPAQGMAAWQMPALLVLIVVLLAAAAYLVWRRPPQRR